MAYLSSSEHYFPIDTTSPSRSVYTTSNNLHVHGRINATDDITIDGKSISDRLDAIEERLGLIEHNLELEGVWDELKELGTKYREKEREIKEQIALMEALKS